MDVFAIVYIALAFIIAFVALGYAISAKNEILKLRIELFELTLEYGAKFEYLDRYSRYLSKHYALNDKAIEHKVLTFKEFCNL